MERCPGCRTLLSETMGLCGEPSCRFWGRRVGSGDRAVAGTDPSDTTYLDRMSRLDAGWHGNRWKNPLARLRDQYFDPEERREMAYQRQRERAAADPVYAADDAWAPLMARYARQLGVLAPRHERGAP